MRAKQIAKYLGRNWFWIMSFALAFSLVEHPLKWVKTPENALSIFYILSSFLILVGFLAVTISIVTAIKKIEKQKRG